MSEVIRSSIRQILIPNKRPDKYFGVDFFASFLHGSDPSYQFFSSLIDPIQTFQEEPVEEKQDALEVFSREIAHLNRGTIIGFPANPDPYTIPNGLMKQALERCRVLELGVLIETSSLEILHDLPQIQKLAEVAPVVVVVPIAFTRDPLTTVFETEQRTTFAQRIKLVHALREANILCGIVMKPIIPFVNDSVETLQEVIDKAVQVHASFVYPNFVLSFTEDQRRRFLSLIDKQFPVLRNLYMDKFGSKRTWATPNQSALKKEFVFSVKKHHMPYGMNEIVALIQPVSTTQYSLF